MFIVQVCLKYLEAVDKLTGSSFKQEFLEAFDEDGDGIVTYTEFGKKGIAGTMMWLGGESVALMGSEKLGYLKARFVNVLMSKVSDPAYNADGHDVFYEMRLGGNVVAAWQMSQMDMEMDDPFQPGLKWGKGKWPSFELAKYFQPGVSVYGQGFPFGIMPPSLYSAVFFYADITQNGGRYAGEIRTQPDPEVVSKYLARLANEEEKPLDFTLYVPEGYGDLSGNMVPNVEVTTDPAKVFTVVFNGGEEIWPDSLI